MSYPTPARRRDVAGRVWLLWPLVLLVLLAPPAHSQVWKQASPYTQRRLLKEVPFGIVSPWHIAWRSWHETVPAQRPKQMAGINFTFEGEPRKVEALARYLAGAGFTHARVEVPMHLLDWDDPNRFAPGVEERLKARFDAIKRGGLRPLVLMNAHHGHPVPARPLPVRLARPGYKGETRVKLEGDYKSVVPHRSGISRLPGQDDVMCDLLFVAPADPDGWVTVSRPLPADLPVTHDRFHTMRLRPFNGAGSEETLRAWRAMAGNLARLLNNGGDIENWNEESFGSRFLNKQSYHKDPIAGGDKRADLIGAVLAGTRPYPGVGVTDGLQSQSPWASAANMPAGVTAASRHYYPVHRRYHQGRPDPGLWANDALGRNIPRLTAPGGRAFDEFEPSFTALFPEYWLELLHTESMARDLTPYPGDGNIYDTPHGRQTRHPVTGERLQYWMTETGIQLSQMLPGKGDAPEVRAARRRQHAAALLRHLLMYSHKGLDRLYLYADFGGHGYLGEALEEAARTGRPLTPDLDSPAVAAWRRTTAKLKPYSGPIRSVEVASIRDRHNKRQWEGDPKHPESRPPLYDREVTAVLPFQTSPDSFVVAVYVATRDVTKPYAPAEFEIRLKGLKPGTGKRAVWYDPLTSETVPATIQWHADGVTTRIQLTDYPRLLLITKA